MYYAYKGDTLLLSNWANEHRLMYLGCSSLLFEFVFFLDFLEYKINKFTRKATNICNLFVGKLICVEKVYFHLIND